MFLLGIQNNFYIILSSYVEGHVKKKQTNKQTTLKFHVFSWFPGLQNLWVFLENLLWSKFWNHFQAEMFPRAPFLDFLVVFHLVWKNQENWELWLILFWINTNSKKQKISAIFICFCATIIDSLTTLKY